MFNTNTLRHRQSASSVIKKVNQMPESSSIVIDFKGIVFASRSFCHELLLGLRNRRNIIFKNRIYEVEMMMNAVSTKPKIDISMPTKLEYIKV